MPPASALISPVMISLDSILFMLIGSVRNQLKTAKPHNPRPCWLRTRKIEEKQGKEKGKGLLDAQISVPF
jgi:hypothetical protein